MRLPTVCGALALLLASIGVTAPKDARAQTCDRIVVTRAEGWFPYSVSVDDRFAGLGADIVEGFVAARGATIEHRVGRSWARGMRELRRGAVDLVLAAYKTEDRARDFVVSAPYAADDVRAFVAAASPLMIDEPEDLIGRRGGRPLGGSFGEAFDRFLAEKLTIVEIPESRDSPRAMLARGRIDYYLAAENDGRMRLGADARPSAAVLASNSVHVLFSRASDCGAGIAAAFDAHLDAMAADGRLDALARSYAQSN